MAAGMKPSAPPSRAARAWRAAGRWLLDHESRLFAVVLGALAADQWRTLALNLGEYRVFIDSGIYDTPLLSLLVTALSALYMTVIVFILWTARPPQARYETLMPNLLAALAGFGIYAFGLLPPGPEPIGGVQLALALLAVGVLLVLWGLRHLRRSFSVVPQARSFVCTGPYRFVRHPMYLGNQFTLAGLGLLVGTGESLVLAVLMIGLQVWRSRYEDRLLASSFVLYRDYMNRTNAFIPRWRALTHWPHFVLGALCLLAMALPEAAAQRPPQGAALKARQSAQCQGWHQKALAGKWFTEKEAEVFAATDGDQEGMSSVPACKAFFDLQSQCQGPAIDFWMASEGATGPISKELARANTALIQIIQEMPGCKSVAGFEHVCNAIRMHVKRGQALTPKLRTMMRECADRRVAKGTSGLIRGAL